MHLKLDWDQWIQQLETIKIICLQRRLQMITNFLAYKHVTMWYSPSLLLRRLRDILVVHMVFTKSRTTKYSSVSKLTSRHEKVIRIQQFKSKQSEYCFDRKRATINKVTIKQLQRQISGNYKDKKLLTRARKIEIIGFHTMESFKLLFLHNSIFNAVLRSCLPTETTHSMVQLWQLLHFIDDTKLILSTRSRLN